MLDPEGHKRKTARNRAQSASVLTHHGVEYTVHNHGAHLVVEGWIDFWPGTGKFIVRATGRNGRGVFNLLKLLKK